MDSQNQSFSKDARDDVYNHCQSNWDVQSWKWNGVDYDGRGIGLSWLCVTRETNKDIRTNHEKDCEAGQCDVEIHDHMRIWTLNIHEECQEWRLPWNTRVRWIVCWIYVGTCFHQVDEDQSRQSIDCWCSEKAVQNQLEMPFMVKLDELCWLKNGSMLIPSLKLNSPWAPGRSWWGQEQRGCQVPGTKAKGRQTAWSLPEVQGTVVILPRSKRCHTGRKKIIVGWLSFVRLFVYWLIVRSFVHSFIHWFPEGPRNL